MGAISDTQILVSFDEGNRECADSRACVGGRGELAWTPAELIRATQQAIADELEHVRPGLDLASRHAGAVLGPGSFALLAKPTIFGTVSDSRTGDPVANALAMLEEGCINETVAAAQAAVAALQCREPGTKSVLEMIASLVARLAHMHAAAGAVATSGPALA